jgi:glutaredoxin 3
MIIKVYTRPTCQWCEKLKKWLKKKKIEFEELDVSESQSKENRDELLEKTGQLAVPVIAIGEQIIIGFDEKAIEQAIKKN